MSMEFGGFLNNDNFFSNDSKTDGKIPHIINGISSETTTNIVLTALLSQLMGINNHLEEISKTLKEFIVEDDEYE